MQGRYLLLRLARLEAACDYHDGSQAHALRSILVVAQREHLSRLSQHVGVCECQRRHLQSGLLDPIHTFGWLRGLYIVEHRLPADNVSIRDGSAMKKRS